MLTRDTDVLAQDLDFRSDPTDELIASTRIVHRVPVVTRDERIRSSKLVPLAV
jgi:predicted nucleic acid-binding protein